MKIATPPNLAMAMWSPYFQFQRQTIIAFVDHLSSNEAPRAPSHNAMYRLQNTFTAPRCPKFSVVHSRGALLGTWWPQLYMSSSQELCIICHWSWWSWWSLPICFNLMMSTMYAHANCNGSGACADRNRIFWMYMCNRFWTLRGLKVLLSQASSSTAR